MGFFITMTAIELINKLQLLEPDTKIIIRGYEGGFNNILELKPMNIRENSWREEINDDLTGRYCNETDYYYVKKDLNIFNTNSIIKAVELHGYNYGDQTIDI